MIIQLSWSKKAGERLIDILHRLIVTVWNTGVWPAGVSRFVCQFSKRGSSRHANNRSLSLISHASKILLCIIKDRIRGKVEQESPPKQAGFRRGMGTHNHITSLRILTEEARSRQQPLFFCFVDFKQAYDSVCHAKQWKGLRKLGFPPHLINLIESLYENSKSRVRWDRKKTKTFTPRRGTRQRCLISRDLFNLMAELLMRIALSEYTEGVKIGGIRHTNLRYADDIILIAGSNSELQNLVSRVLSASTEMGLQINIEKTAVMSLNTSEKPELESYDERIPIVKTLWSCRMRQPVRLSFRRGSVRVTWNWLWWNQS